jgi:tripartite-type tricarboxylate transporter receptor subunit TctC
MGLVATFRVSLSIFERPRPARDPSNSATTTPISYRGFVGLAAPAKTPASIIAYLNRELNEVVQSPQFRSRMEVLGMTVPAENTPQLLLDYMRRETRRQGELAALTGITMTKPK